MDKPQILKRRRKFKMERQPDFTGWATRYNVKCSDGRTILPDAFKHCDGETVPLIWNHQHNDPKCVVGHVVLKHCDEGMRADGYVNNSDVGQDVKEQLAHGDINSLSIYANHLKHRGSDVYHGAIREVSLVLAGANPGAYIDSVLVHGDGDSVIETDEARIYNDETIELYHADEEEKSDDTDNKKDSEADGKTDKTVIEIIEGLPEEEQKAVFAAIGMALDAGEDDDDDDDDETIKHSEGGNETMKANVFDKGTTSKDVVLSHSDQEKILDMAKSSSIGSLQAALAKFSADESLSHGLDLGDTDVLEELLPDHKLLNPGAPEILRADQSWVMSVINKIHKSPYSRIRTRKADARIADLRAKGYKKGEEKKKMNDIKLLGRKTEPTTVYLKDELNRDDIIDITDFDVVSYVWNMMKDSMYETLALAALVGDGREDGDADKIDENNIRPIWKDDEFYTIHKDVDIAAAKAELQGTNTSANFGENYIYAEAMITAALYSREKFKGSGQPTLYCAPHLVNVMLLARDLNGRRIYDSKADLAKALNVAGIVEIEQLEGKVRTDAEGNQKKLLGLFVNLADYQFGSTKGGEITRFDDFDIDFNKYKYLMETRLSGALTEPASAIALEEPVAAG
jgi:HK97 family phage prohead protease